MARHNKKARPEEEEPGNDIPSEPPEILGESTKRRIGFVSIVVLVLVTTTLLGVGGFYALAEAGDADFFKVTTLLPGTPLYEIGAENPSTTLTTEDQAGMTIGAGSSREAFGTVTIGGKKYEYKLSDLTKVKSEGWLSKTADKAQETRDALKTGTYKPLKGWPPVPYFVLLGVALLLVLPRIYRYTIEYSNYFTEDVVLKLNDSSGLEHTYKGSIKYRLIARAESQWRLKRAGIRAVMEWAKDIQRAYLAEIAQATATNDMFAACSTAAKNMLKERAFKALERVGIQVRELYTEEVDPSKRAEMLKAAPQVSMIRAKSLASFIRELTGQAEMSPSEIQNFLEHNQLLAIALMQEGEGPLPSVILGGGKG
ncbi:hypothetical protein A3K34_04420 [candidate division WWE3 bacterium RIFOXYC1_FULL_40_10]|uniref:Uncharacterized protein n=1 Tax=candidate division WWE3 bacterium RIFOXYA2_FULL_46_9 TaxID=1802636 RepID=A0A1F4W0Z7_UNCKA|nr:MAG: hypothetical protein A3K58_04420 [candidate division WWE3 bacterium RIFOXYB1_FULL_40_22]OGC62087.1 MAG: hypothetical protein A3K37_04420 [candidate division WWE3 bacterium RIFOXYA1_FULL_40_11]OGC63102.1 MAG: hypothetical protein A2264_00165 [candidate division WWE3 bacterium RIFOXYA2_FULL_46_9]OGC66470.1 MAG: hypothetical protein A3K34_04420 [candidate division WWE3 bacterium RIFOXYC1_FULL_40_10]OGC67210.1 MAG: hypothetical protein A2450_00040 [candidate division WWE3 bacterium RIFOXYC2